MATEPRPGDRSLRDDDRYLFLESLLAAGDRLILSYVGRSQKDGSEREPSTVVSELLDHLDRTFVGSGAAAARHQLLVEHRLQPWSPAYFDATDRRLYSYSVENGRAARALLGRPQAPPPFVDRDLDAGDGDLRLELEDLVRFWLHPCRHFCRQVLGFDLGGAGGEEADSEPFLVDGLESFALRQWLVDRRLAAATGAGDEDGGEEAELELLRAAGDLPAADLGAAQYRQLRRRAEAFVRRLPAHRRLRPVAIAVDGPGYRIGGRLDTVTDLGPLRFRCARLRPRDLLRTWIEHLALAVWRIDRGETADSSRLVGEDRQLAFDPPADPPSLLAELVAGYRHGRSAPLPFFERASHDYAERAAALVDPRRQIRRTPLEAARQAFDGNAPGAVRPPADGDDPHVRQCFGAAHPLDDPAFGRWAERVWRPALACLREAGP